MAATDVFAFSQGIIFLTCFLKELLIRQELSNKSTNKPITYGWRRQLHRSFTNHMRKDSKQTKMHKISRLSIHSRRKTRKYTDDKSNCRSISAFSSQNRVLSHHFQEGRGLDASMFDPGSCVFIGVRMDTRQRSHPCHLSYAG
jgi:hypothetical protein